MNRIRPIFRTGAALGVLAFLGAQRSSLAQTAAAPAPTAPPKWEKSAAAGLSLTSGNTDSVLFTANILGAKKWGQHEVSLGADASYGETEDVKSSELLRGFGQYNRLINEGLFGYARGEALHDAVADVDYRLSLSPGMGYYFIKNPQTSLSSEVGPGLVYEKQGNDEEGYLSLRLAERFEHKFNERVRVWQSLEILPQVDDFGNTLVNAEIGVESALTDKLKLRVYVVDTYDSDPAQGSKKNDVKLVTSLALNF